MVHLRKTFSKVLIFSFLSGAAPKEFKEKQ